MPVAKLTYADLAAFQQSGYRICRLQPFDLFPQTRHIENIATLQKIGV